MGLSFLSVLDSVDSDCKKPALCILSDRSHEDFAIWSRAIESASDFFSILMLNTYWKTLAGKAEIWWAMRFALPEEEQNLMTECDKFCGLPGQTDIEKGKIVLRRIPMKKLRCL